MDLYEQDVKIYVGYTLENPEKVEHLMTYTKRRKIEDFIYSKGRDSIVGGLIAIYRIRNNLFHGIKEIKDLNKQIELFKAMNSFLEQVI